MLDTQSSEQSLSTPISDQKQQANQLNAPKATDPKSPEGKSRSAKNATKHGGYALDPFLQSVNPDEYNPTTTEIPQIEATENQPPIPAPTPTAVARVVANEKAQNEPKPDLELMHQNRPNPHLDNNRLIEDSPSPHLIQ